MASRCAELAATGKSRGRLKRHLLSSLCCLGPHTLTAQIATAGRQFEDWSADYRLYSWKRAEPEGLWRGVREELISLVPAGAPLVVAVDDTRLRKTSPRTAGVSYQRDPLGPPFHTNLMLAQRFIQQSLAVPDGRGVARLVPIDLTHAPVPRKPRRNSEPEQWEAYRQAQREQTLGRVACRRLQHLRQELDSQPATKDRLLLAAVDGGYTNRTFLRSLPDQTAVIGRIRGDAKLYYLPEAGGGRGRRRVYGADAPTPEELRQNGDISWELVRVHFGGDWREIRVKTLAPLRWRATGATHDLRLVVIAPTGYQLTQHGRRLYRKPAYLICTDPTLSVAEIVQNYLWRWDIEVNFRDEKTVLGVGQARVRHPDSVGSVPAVAVAAYSILLTAGLRYSGLNGSALELPPPKWQHRPPRRATVSQLITQLRHDLWGRSLLYPHFAHTHTPNTKCDKFRPALAPALFYGAKCA
jgi:hypothetical protein